MSAVLCMTWRIPFPIYKMVCCNMVTNRGATKLISILTLANYNLCLVIIIVHVILEGYANGDTKQWIYKNLPLPFKWIGFVFMANYYCNSFIILAASYWRSIQIPVWCVCVVEIPINAMLLYGSTSKRRYFILPWLITTMLQIAVQYNSFLILIV